jgi:hypothetical protein
MVGNLLEDLGIDARIVSNWIFKEIEGQNVKWLYLAKDEVEGRAQTKHGNEPSCSMQDQFFSLSKFTLLPKDGAYLQLLRNI